MPRLSLFLYFYVSFLFSTFFTIYAWHELSGKKIDFKNIRVYICLMLITLLTTVLYYSVNSFVRVLLLAIVLIFSYSILFKEEIKKSVILVIVIEVILLLSEVILSILLSVIFSISGSEIIDIENGRILINIVIMIISFIILKSRICKKTYLLLLKMTKNIKFIQLFLFSFIFILFSIVLFGISYYNIDFVYLLIFNTILIFSCFFIVFYSLKTKNNYNNIYDKYNTTLNSLKEYEIIMDKYRISNHENKNQLLTIRNMIPKTNKKVINYIDQVVENNLKDNDKVMLETTKIPAGGLRGLIYSKILLMKNLNISYELIVSNDVKTVDLIKNIDDSTMLDICKIIGVYLDNSIQAVENIQDKCISIEMYIENKILVVSISNTYKNTIELDRIEDKGYTSKGKGHGYGLTLAKEIIDSNEKLLNEKQISKDFFTQILKIKM